MMSEHNTTIPWCVYKVTWLKFQKQYFNIWKINKLQSFETEQ